MTNLNETQPAATQDLDEASLDLVVGAGVIIHDIILHDIVVHDTK